MGELGQGSGGHRLEQEQVGGCLGGSRLLSFTLWLGHHACSSLGTRSALSGAGGQHAGPSQAQSPLEGGGGWGVSLSPEKG